MGDAITCSAARTAIWPAPASDVIPDTSAGAAASSTAGNAVATPLAIAQADPSLAEVAAAAAPLIAASVITTAILTPILTSWVAKKQARQVTQENKA